MAYLDGKLYLHSSDGGNRLLCYDIASNSWESLLPPPATLDPVGAIDPVARKLYSDGNGTLYSHDIVLRVHPKNR